MRRGEKYNKRKIIFLKLWKLVVLWQKKKKKKLPFVKIVGKKVKFTTIIWLSQLITQKLCYFSAAKTVHSWKMQTRTAKKNNQPSKHSCGVHCVPKHTVMEPIWGSLQKICHFSEVKWTIISLFLIMQFGKKQWSTLFLLWRKLWGHIKQLTDSCLLLCLVNFSWTTQSQQVRNKTKSQDCSIFFKWLSHLLILKFNFQRTVKIMC